MPNPFAICANDVRHAAQMLSGVAVRTPLLEYAALNERAGRRVLIKFEGAQHTGSFKFRGAYNRLARLEGAAKAAGVVAWSSGNHAQGVAAAARRCGMPAIIVMPADAPAIKLANTRALGAKIVLYDRYTESREEISATLAAKHGATLVPPFNDAFVIAGQGTAGLEILAQAEAAGAALGQVLVCCGGGGLTAGVATAIKDSRPEVDVYSVEPAAFDDTARSLVSGRRETVAIGARSICDALLTPTPGEMTFPINRALLSGGLAVSDEQVQAAMRFAFETLKLVIEPGGAVALAAVLQGVAPATKRATAVVVSGSNVDPDVFAGIISDR
jgi:threonine dehydratase